MKITRETTREELAAIVASHLAGAGIAVVLVGGSVAAIYSSEKYVTYDLDFTSWASTREIGKEMAKLGFTMNGRLASHPDTAFSVDFVGSPVMIGHKHVPDAMLTTRTTSHGAFQLLSPLDCVLDRLAAFYHYQDRQGLEQAVAITRAQRVAIADVEAWSTAEGRETKGRGDAFAVSFAEFRRLLGP